MTDDDGIVYQLTDLTSLHLTPNSIDLAYSSLALHYLEDVDALFTTLYQALTPLLDNASFPAMLTAVETRSIKAQAALDDNELAIALLPLATACARASLSRFNVGAIARGVSGNLYFGSNMEFPGTTMQQTINAEQSAISHAWMRGETGLAAITVNHTPCGHCRQFMNELNSGINLRIHLPGRPAATLGDYLPETFGPGDLSISRRLMDMQDRDLQGEGMRFARLLSRRQIAATPLIATHQAVWRLP